MRRSICYTEPNVAYAGERSTWKFTYTTSVQLPKGTRLRFDVASLEHKGRPLEWQVPQTQSKDKGNYIWVEVPGAKPFSGSALENGSSYEFTLPIEVKGGESFSILIGTPDTDRAKKGNCAQKLVQRRRPFHLYIDPKGKGDYKDPETFHLDVRGGELKTLRIIAPSLVSRNKRFDVIVRFEDAFGNLTSNAPEGTLIELSYQHLRENLNWKLFVPETGFISLPNLYFNEPGIYKIQLKNLRTGELFFSPPIKCLADSAVSLYWGLFHGESDRVDSGENIESLLRHMRDDRALQFFATSSFDAEEETSNDLWKLISQQVSEFNEDDRFVALLGFQWAGEPKVEGVRQFLYAKDLKPILRRKDTKNNSLKKIYKTNNPKEMLSIPSFTMGKESPFSFEEFQPEFERVVEIYNAWGSSECTAKEGNLRPIQKGKKVVESSEGAITAALNRGCRFGFTAGGYDDRGIYAPFFDSDQVQYSQGLTAVLSKEHSRASIIEALHARSCYATTGERIVVGLQIAGQPMGSELDTKSRPGLEFNRHITGYAIGTQPLAEVLLMRNGKEFKSFKPKDERFELEFDDMDLLGEVSLESSFPDRSPFTYYYLKVIQKDGHIAWSSPIWIDLNARSAPLGGGKKAKKRG